MQRIHLKYTCFSAHDSKSNNSEIFLYVEKAAKRLEIRRGDRLSPDRDTGLAG